MALESFTLWILGHMITFDISTNSVDTNDAFVVVYLHIEHIIYSYVCYLKLGSIIYYYLSHVLFHLQR